MNKGRSHYFIYRKFGISSRILLSKLDLKKCQKWIVAAAKNTDFTVPTIV